MREGEEGAGDGGQGRGETMKQRMLFLDDEDWRHRLADERYGQRFDVFHCRTVAQVRASLHHDKFDVVSLDHDLAERLTGMHAVEALCEMPQFKRPDTVVVHSWNVSAADMMVFKLERNGFRVVRKMFRAPHSSHELAPLAEITEEQMPPSEVE